MFISNWFERSASYSLDGNVDLMDSSPVIETMSMASEVRFHWKRFEIIFALVGLHFLCWNPPSRSGSCGDAEVQSIRPKGQIAKNAF